MSAAARVVSTGELIKWRPTRTRPPNYIAALSEADSA